jgi:hypothetical protein
MTRFLRIGGVVLAGALLLAQLVRPKPNLGPVGGPNDLMVREPTPEAVRAVLAEACFDCHSNRTRYPWYANFQPVGWWLGEHVEDGKNDLNFSEFGAYPAQRAGRKLGAIARDLERGKMPLPSYLWMHPRARLTAKERQLVIDWANGLRAKLGGDH